MSNRTVLFLSVLFALCCVSMSLVYGWMVTSDIEMFKVKMGGWNRSEPVLRADSRNIRIPCFCFHNDFISNETPQEEEDNESETP